MTWIVNVPVVAFLEAHPVIRISNESTNALKMTDKVLRISYDLINENTALLNSIERTEFYDNYTDLFCCGKVMYFFCDEQVFCVTFRPNTRLNYHSVEFDYF